MMHNFRFNQVGGDALFEHFQQNVHVLFDGFSISQVSLILRIEFL